MAPSARLSPALNVVVAAAQKAMASPVAATYRPDRRRRRVYDSLYTRYLGFAEAVEKETMSHVR